MGKLAVSEFVSLDGVFEDPGGAEGFKHGGWTFKFDRGAEGDQFKLDELRAADVLLLGRITYEGFAAAWPQREGTGEFGDRMNAISKYVVSSTLERADWNNSTVLAPVDAMDRIARLKEEVPGHILVAGSGQLVRSLMRAGLVDEYRLMLFPIVLGTGKRLFDSSDAPASLRLLSAEEAGDSLILTYLPR